MPDSRLKPSLFPGYRGKIVEVFKLFLKKCQSMRYFISFFFLISTSLCIHITRFLALYVQCSDRAFVSVTVEVDGNVVFPVGLYHRGKSVRNSKITSRFSH
jgi:hypothetical protein